MCCFESDEQQNHRIDCESKHTSHNKMAGSLSCPIVFFACIGLNVLLRTLQ